MDQSQALRADMADYTYENISGNDSFFICMNHHGPSYKMFLLLVFELCLVAYALIVNPFLVILHNHTSTCFELLQQHRFFQLFFPLQDLPSCYQSQFSSTCSGYNHFGAALCYLGLCYGMFKSHFFPDILPTKLDYHLPTAFDELFQ